MSNGFTKVTDGLGRETKYYFDQTSWRQVVKKIEGPCNCGSGSEVTQFFYDNNLNITKKIDAEGHETSYFYDANRNLRFITDVLGTQQFDGYNSFGQPEYYTDRMGGITRTHYDTAGNLEYTIDPTSWPGPTPKTDFAYTTNGHKQLASITDARGNPTSFHYDSQGRMSEMLDAYNGTTYFVYNDRARVTNIHYALEDNPTYFGYDTKDRLNNILYPDKSQVNIVYDFAGRATSVTDENGHTTTYDYDDAYRLTGITDALYQPTNFGYDAMSNMTSQTDALKNITNFEYDPFNRLKTIIYPEASSGETRLQESFTYTNLGELQSHTDSGNHTTNYVYTYSPSPSPSPSPSQSPTGFPTATPSTETRVVTITDALMHSTVLTYNARMQMVKVKDARAVASPTPTQEYTFQYDELGRLKYQSPRVGATPMTFEYDAVGNLTKRVDYNNTTTIYAYDNVNRLTGVSYTGASYQNASYDYDYRSRLQTATNQAGQVSFMYDNRNRLQSETDVWGHTMGYTYDPTGNRKTMSLDKNAYTSYEYDDANNLILLVDEVAGQKFNYSYDSGNRLIQLDRPNGVSTSYGYDGMSRLSRLWHKTGFDPITTLFDEQISYNSANQISQISPLNEVPIKTFTYDNINRLKTVSTGEFYNYDEVGNRTSSHLSSNYATGAFNRLTSVAGSPTTSYVYNANGSRTSKSGSGLPTSYSWDRENRLTSVTRSLMTASNKYDALGRRVSTTFGPTYGLPEEEPNPIRYTYDGLDVMYEDSDDLEFATTKYQNGPGIDNKLKQETNGNASYFLQDHLGSTVKMTNSSGSVTESNGYDSFGRPTNPYFSSRYQFTGREYDSFSGLQYSRARFYDPQIGRFISEDPIGFAGGINLYAYVGNHPTMFTDPLGFFPSIWPFDYHQQITRSALLGRAKPQEIESMNLANQRFDEETQDDQYAPHHAMRRVGQGDPAARAAANKFVRDQICLAREYESRGWHTYALYELAKAMHAVQDAKSPAHQGFQEAWPNTAVHMILNWQHYAEEMFFPGKQNWRDAEQATQEIWDNFKGAPMPNDFFPNP